jgi:hypothetical protein
MKFSQVLYLGFLILMNYLPRGDRYDGSSAPFASGTLIEGRGAYNAHTDAGL